jgi:hypothetical protein
MPKRKSLTTKPLNNPGPIIASPSTITASAPVMDETPVPIATEETEPANPTRDTLIRLLNGEEPADRREAFLWLRWNRLARRQRLALAYEWNLPFHKREDKDLAEAAMRELGDLPVGGNGPAIR